MKHHLLGVTTLLVACAGGSGDPAEPAARAETKSGAPAPADVDGKRRDFTRPGDPPPLFKPSSRSNEKIAITTDAYGAYKFAPKAPRLGDTAEDFELPLADGGTFKLAEARKAGPVLVMFYRGFW